MCWLSKIVSLLGVPVYYFVYKKKTQPHTARCLCKRSQAVRRVAAAHLVCYGHFSPGRRLSPPETPPEASSPTAAKQFQVPPVSARRLSGERALKDLFFSPSPLDSHVVEHRFCIICIVKKQVNAEIRQVLKQTPQSARRARVPRWLLPSTLTHLQHVSTEYSSRALSVLVLSSSEVVKKNKKQLSCFTRSLTGFFCHTWLLLFHCQHDGQRKDNKMTHIWVVL